MKCKVCESDSPILFNTKVLDKYNVNYHQCSKCKFIQTEKAYWLDEAYKSAITNLDIGLISRNNYYSIITKNLIFKFFDIKGAFLDYGGGYGMLVRMMRDKGLNFFRQDVYCDNLFSVHFDVNDTQITKFELVTAFEVFEHLDDPVDELVKMMQYSENILFSTELQPETIITPDDWWYFIPSTGQHIALYSYESLNALAKKFDLYYYNKNSLHLFTRKKISNLSFKIMTNSKLTILFDFLYKGKSLLMSDFEKLKSIYSKKVV